MNNKLWTGESVFCVCGHHVEFHKTDQKMLAIADGQEHIIYKCNYLIPVVGDEDRVCKCTEFKPYKVS